jgi:CBS domain-containing protein
MQRSSKIPSRSAVDRLEAVSVGEVMQAGVISCPVETPLLSVASLMSEHRVHCIVGVGDATEDDTAVWGVVTDTDVVAALARGGVSASAGDVATSEVVTIGRSEPVWRAAELMRDHEVSHVLVVDAHSDRPLGIVSTLDVMALAATPRH